MECSDHKKPVSGFCKKFAKSDDESTFSGLQQYIIDSLGSKTEEVWSPPYYTYKSLKESR